MTILNANAALCSGIKNDSISSSSGFSKKDSPFCGAGNFPVIPLALSQLLSPPRVTCCPGMPRSGHVPRISGVQFTLSSDGATCCLSGTEAVALQALLGSFIDNAGTNVERFKIVKEA